MKLDFCGSPDTNRISMRRLKLNGLTPIRYRESTGVVRHGAIVSEHTISRGPRKGVREMTIHLIGDPSPTTIEGDEIRHVQVLT